MFGPDRPFDNAGHFRGADDFEAHLFASFGYKYSSCGGKPRPATTPDLDLWNTFDEADLIPKSMRKLLSSDLQSFASLEPVEVASTPLPYHPPQSSLAAVALASTATDQGALGGGESRLFGGHPSDGRPKIGNQMLMSVEATPHIYAAKDESILPLATPKTALPMLLPPKMGFSPMLPKMPTIVTPRYASPPEVRSKRQMEGKKKSYSQNGRYQANITTSKSTNLQGSALGSADENGRNRLGPGWVQEDPEDAGPVVFTTSIAIGALDAQEAPPKVDGQQEWHTHTTGMVSSLESWLNSDSLKNLGDGPRPGGKKPKPSMTAEEDEAAKRQAAYYRAVLAAARKFGLPVREIQIIHGEFAALCVNNQDEIDHEVFARHLRKKAGVPLDKPVPLHLLCGCTSGKMNFDRFVQWSVNTSWSEEMLMPDAEERGIRHLAREQGLKLPDVERVKKMFDEFDVDGSGEIDEEEFIHILYRLLKVKDLSDVPLKRLKRYWREVDVDGSGAIVFKEFLIWYRNSFMSEFYVAES